MSSPDHLLDHLSCHDLDAQIGRELQRLLHSGVRISTEDRGSFIVLFDLLAARIARGTPDTSEENQ